LNNHLNLKIYY